MKRRSTTKQPHDPHELYLDEGVSGPTFASLLTKAQIPVHQFQKLLPKNKKVPDSRVIEAASEARYVIVSTDSRMESVWTDDLITHKAKVILLTDDAGGPIHWAAALICSRSSWVRVLLDHPDEAVIIRLTRTGAIKKVVGDQELRHRRDQLLTVRIVQAKRSGKSLRRER